MNTSSTGRRAATGNKDSKASILGKLASLGMLQFVMGLVAFVAVGAMTVGASQAVFGSSTSNDGNTWTAGSVTLTNDKATAMFTATGVVPGYTESHCINIISGSDVATQLSFFTELNSQTKQLGDHLKITVETGTGGTDGATACTGFVPSATLLDGTASALAASNGTAVSAAPVAAPLAAGGTRQFKITATLPSGTTPDTVQAGTVSLDFNWVSRSL